MLFGNFGRRGGRPNMQPMNTGIVPPAQQPPTGVMPTANPMMPTWAAPTQDMGYSSNLAQMFAGQLQNQAVPGSYTPQLPSMIQPAAGQQSPATPQGPLVSQQPNDWRNAFHTAMSAWQQQRPMGQMTGDQKMQWMQGRPDRHAFRLGNY